MSHNAENLISLLKIRRETDKGLHDLHLDHIWATDLTFPWDARLDNNQVGMAYFSFQEWIDDHSELISEGSREWPTIKLINDWITKKRKNEQ